MFSWRTFGVICMVAFFGSRAAMAPANGLSSPDPFPLGLGLGYLAETTVLLNEPGGRGLNVGYRISAKINVGAVWDSANGEKLLKIELLYPKLHVKSRKAPSPEGFVEHSSRLDSAVNKPFYVIWQHGKVDQIYIDKDEALSMVNLKRGLASLFQFQQLEGEHMELDTSGECLVSYSTSGPHSAMRKSKKNCLSGDTGSSGQRYDRIRPELALRPNIDSKRDVIYEFGPEGMINKIIADEWHEMVLVLKKDAGSNVRTKISLVLEDKNVKMQPMKGSNFIEVTKSLKNVVARTLRTEREPNICQEEQCPTMQRLVSEHRSALAVESVGGSRAANAFVKILPSVRAANTDQILAVLDNDNNKGILAQLCDLLGSAQTLPAHQAVKRFLDLDNSVDLDFWERYLWAQSMGANPDKEVMADILKIVKKPSTRDAKLTDTLTQTVAAMAKAWTKMEGRSYDDKIVQQISKHLTQSLQNCQKDECKLMYLRSLRNLQDPSTIKILLQYALQSSKQLSVTAMKALRNFPKRFLQYDTVQKTCRRIFFEIPKKFDSSARTLALDILLENEATEELLKEILEFLRSPDKAFEVKQYVLQRIRHESDEDEKFAQRVQNVLRKNVEIANYHVLGQKGLSTAFSREFARSNGSSSDLATIQEMYGGMLKRGVVDINLKHDQSEDNIHNLMSLGMFAGGLTSFVSSSDSSDQDEQTEQDEASAGMEITVHDVTIRPFVFFTGQGELMGHVWSGTGSDKTPAYQATTLLYDHQQAIPLQTGAVAELSLIGGASVDLSGQIQISLWNRNAHSLVETNGGASVLGQLRVDNAFVRTLCEFSITAEPRFHIDMNVDFYDKMALCMRPQQPDVVVKHNTFKIERIPGSKHNLRKSTYRTNKVSGKTHALNRKNSEMCNAIFR